MRVRARIGTAALAAAAMVAVAGCQSGGNTDKIEKRSATWSTGWNEPGTAFRMLRRSSTSNDHDPPEETGPARFRRFGPPSPNVTS